MTHLRYAGFMFLALPDAFVVHMPHDKSTARRDWERGGPRSARRAAADKLYQRLVGQLVAKYGKPRTPACTRDA